MALSLDDVGRIGQLARIELTQMEARQVLSQLQAIFAVMSGMLYKIMPFLAWFHLQSTRGREKRAPNMKTILPDARQRLQFRSHVLALALLCAAALWPGTFVYPAALALAATAALLETNMLVVVRAYRDNLSQASDARSPS